MTCTREMARAINRRVNNDGVFLLWTDVNQTPRDKAVVDLVNNIFDTLPDRLATPLPAARLSELAHDLKKANKGHTVMPHIHHVYVQKLVDVMTGKNAHIYLLPEKTLKENVLAADMLQDVFREWSAAAYQSIGRGAKDKLDKLIIEGITFRDKAKNGHDSASRDTRYGISVPAPKYF